MTLQMQTFNDFDFLTVVFIIKDEMCLRGGIPTCHKTLRCPACHCMTECRHESL